MWEALAAIGSIASALVITVTVILTARQVRATVEQLEQVRRATQFEAARTVLLDFADRDFTNAYRFVYSELEGRLADDSFRREVALIGIADDRVHQELTLLRAFDRIGAYVRFGLVDGAVIYTGYLPRILLSWELLRTVVAIHRQFTDEHFWENAQFLYDDCRRWATANGRDINVNAMRERVAAATTTTTVPEVR